MKTYRIFALPSHATKDRVSGVDYARIIQPMRYLNGYTNGEVEFKVDIYDPIRDEHLDWGQVAQNHDAIYLNYTAVAWSFAAMGLMARKAGIPIIMDVDDSLWSIQPDNPTYEAFKPGSENIHNFTAMCNEVDYMTTTNKYLRNVICRYTNKPTTKVVVFPNYIDLKLYKHRSKFKDTGQITLLHFGSTTHFVDLAEEQFEKGIDRIMRDYPNVKLKTVGALLPKYKYKWGQRYENSYGHQDVLKWVKTKFPDFMDETDILVTPLQENRYTVCKSAIKFLEGSSAKKVGVWQNIRQYSEVVDGKNGFLARSSDDWYNSIKTLIDNPNLRKSMGENAFKTLKDWKIQDHVKDYAKFFISVFDNYKK